MKSPEQETCPYCQGTRLFSVRCLVGPHYSRLGCSDCGRHIKYEAAPWTMERARAFVMPFGKFKGRTVGALADDKQARSYLAWAADNLDGNAGTAAAVALGLKPADMEVAS
jgi:uncharacterized protein (DUF3820 family)